jgi:uncharacterized protein
VTHVDYPYHFASSGRTATTDYDSHIRDMIEQVLFTAPGERLNRPTFGSGLRQLVFAPNSEELATATQLLVQGALQEWLGNLIEVSAVRVSAEDSALRVVVAYTVRRTGTREVAEFGGAQRGAP